MLVTVLLITFFSILFPAVGYYLDWKAKNRKTVKRKTIKSQKI